MRFTSARLRARFAGPQLVLPGISILNPDSDSHQTEGFANPKLKPGIESKGSPHCFNWPVLPRLGTAASLYQPLLQAGQRPVVDPRRQHQAPP
jgi:hypothetical protein